jgi:GTP-binding protein
MHALPAKGTKHFAVKEVSQIGINPPTFLFRVDNVQAVHFTYQRYLENSLRQSFGFEGTPLRLVFKGKGRGKKRSQSGRVSDTAS